MYLGRLLVLVITSILLLGGVTRPDRPGLAQEPALVQLRLAPFQEIRVGNEGTIEVAIARVTDLGGVDLEVRFDPDKLELLTDLQGYPVQLNQAVMNWQGIMPSRGSGWVRFSALSAASMTVGEQTVLLATIRFRLLADGLTNLNLVVHKVAASTGGVVIPASGMDVGLEVGLSGDPVPLARELTISSTQDLAVTRPARIRAAAAEAVTWQVEFTGPNGFPGLPERQAVYDLQAPELDMLWPVPPDPESLQQPWSRALPPGNYQVRVSARDSLGQERHWPAREVSVYNLPLRLQNLQVTQPGQLPGSIKWGQGFQVQVTASNLEAAEIRPWIWLLARRGNEPPMVLGFRNKADRLAGQQDNLITFATDKTKFYGTAAPGLYQLSILVWSESSPASGGVPLASRVIADINVYE